jgi:hypothetical protein
VLSNLFDYQITKRRSQKKSFSKLEKKRVRE